MSKIKVVGNKYRMGGAGGLKKLTERLIPSQYLRRRCFLNMLKKPKVKPKLVLKTAVFKPGWRDHA